MLITLCVELSTEYIDSEGENTSQSDSSEWESEYEDDSVETGTYEEETPSVDDATPSFRPRKIRNVADVPVGFDISKWKDGEFQLAGIPPFLENSDLHVVPHDATELYFFKLFITDVVVDELVYQTNLYASQYTPQYIEANTISQRSCIKKWPKDGITASDMKSYLALTFYMGLVHKDNFKSYWSIDSVLLTPFLPFSDKTL